MALGFRAYILRRLESQMEKRMEHEMDAELR